MGKLKLELDALEIQSFATQQAETRRPGTVKGNMVPAETSECGYTEAECHNTGGSGGTGNGWTNGDTCDPYWCGGNYTVFSCQLTCGC